LISLLHSVLPNANKPTFIPWSCNSVVSTRCNLSPNQDGSWEGDAVLVPAALELLVRRREVVDDDDVGEDKVEASVGARNEVW